LGRRHFCLDYCSLLCYSGTCLSLLLKLHKINLIRISIMAEIAKINTDTLPRDMWQAAAKSFAISFALGTLFLGGNMGVGAAVGVLAAITNLVSDVAKPIFRSLWNSPPGEEWWQRGVRRITVLALMGATVAPLLAMRFALVESLAISILVDLVTTGFQPSSWLRSDLTIMV
jgi:hypothetical protein